MPDFGRRLRTELDFRKTLSNKDFENLFTGYFGHFAGIIETEFEVIGFVDPIRSVPLFYRVDEGTIVVSNSARALSEGQVAKHYCQEGLFELVSGGYVTGRNTIRENLFQLRAGELIRIDKSAGRAALSRYYRYLPRLDSHVNSDTLKKLGGNFG